MERLEILNRFLGMTDRDWWPEPLGWEEDGPSILTACVELSGMADEVQTDDDLREAALHTFSLLSAGVVSVRQIAELAEDIEDSAIEWAEEFEAEQFRRALLN